MAYSIILADPPWAFANWSAKGAGRGASRHYATMSLSDISALPVKDIAAKDCALFLWATGPMLPEALDVLKAWEFTFKTVAFVWTKGNAVKTLYTGKAVEFTGQIGNGYWSRSQTEFVLLGVRGKPKRVSKAVRQAILYPRTRHSAKPPEIRERIVALCGDLPRLEMFAREETPGWMAIGDGVDGLDIRESLQRLSALTCPHPL